MKHLMLAFAVLMAASVSAETIFLEAEAFQDWGGWVNDTQFMDQMGSPYLLAHGMGKPVADTKTGFYVVADGLFAVYARTKNWLAWVNSRQGKAALPASPEESKTTKDGPATLRYPGAFDVIVDGQKLATKLVTQGDGEWQWVKVGQLQLRRGSHTIALHDLDGFDGRCDAVVITTNEDPKRILDGPRPPSVIVKRAPQKSYDLVVVGGGIAGICTAISAARLGLKVALVHDRPVLGGNNSSEVRVHLGAWQNMPPYPRLGDVVAEIGPRKGGNAMPASQYEDERKLAVVKAEKNIDLFLNEHVNGVVTNLDGRILCARAKNTRTGVSRKFEAQWFADCTGDGTVGYLAGADFAYGREAKREYHEPWAPENPDTLTMGASVQWYAGPIQPSNPPTLQPSTAFPRLPWMVQFNEKSASRGLKGDWWWEAGIGRDQIAEGEYIRDYGLLMAYSNWAFLKNESSKKAEYADKELKWVAYNAGRRESRRILGEFILTELDLTNRNYQVDGTCATTWTIDLHLPKPKSKTHFEGEAFQSDSFNHKIWPYPIPYRCLYSRKIPNLFMAGRDISVSHIALGTTRLMRTTGMMGEVVGMAASLCKRHRCDPRQIYTDHLAELKTLMEKGVGDGKAHPPQMYNIQDSLDPAFRPNRTNLNYQLRCRNN